MSGAFVIPQERYHSTTGARRAFKQSFGVEWQGDDDMLREAGKTWRQQVGKKGRCEDFVIVMIEVGEQLQPASSQSQAA